MQFIVQSRLCAKSCLPFDQLLMMASMACPKLLYTIRKCAMRLVFAVVTLPCFFDESDFCSDTIITLILRLIYGRVKQLIEQWTERVKENANDCFHTVHQANSVGADFYLFSHRVLYHVYLVLHFIHCPCNQYSKQILCSAPMK